MKSHCFTLQFGSAQSAGRRAVFAALAFTTLVSFADPAPQPSFGGRPPQSPPTAPAVVIAPDGLSRPPMPPDGNTPWSIGQPTDEEQLYLEYLNRSRANPTAEGVLLANTTDPDVLNAYNYFSVNLALFQSEMSTNPAVPPVAMNAQLTSAARKHSQEMLENQYQGHFGTNNSDPGARITAEGYSWSTYGENVFSYAESVFYGYAGFEVDWGLAPGGMQVPPGHRNNDHGGSFREVGIGVIDGSNGSDTNSLPVGPQLVTQDFGTRQGATPMITGVVYYDINGNHFYDIGEGIGGVTVQVPGSTYFAITANSGGYAVPVTSNGTYAISFTATGLSSNGTATVAGQANVKADYVPTYAPPTISGPNPAALTNNNLYSFNGVGAATNHQWEVVRSLAYTTVEGAENGLTNVTVVTSAGYNVRVNDVTPPVGGGTWVFHLAQPSPPTDQYLTLNPVVQLHTNSVLSFAKRLGYSGTAQIAHAQMTTNGGATWTDLWTQTGSGGSGEGSFSTVTLPLSAYGGSTAQFRFVYAFVGGSFYNQTSAGVGFYLDNIAISNADQTLNPVTNNIPSGNSFTFFPTNNGNYSLRVRAQLPGRSLPWGPSAAVTVTNLQIMTIQFANQPVRLGTQFQLNFNVNNYQSGKTFLLLKAPDLGSSWTTDTLATVQTIVPNTQFRFTTTNTAARGFYRVQAN